MPADVTNPSPSEIENDATIDNNAPAGHAKLTVANGAKAGQVLNLTKPVTTLGRPGVQVAAISHKEDKYFLVHIETNGDSPPPSVNGNEIGETQTPLASNDEIIVAGIKMVLQIP